MTDAEYNETVKTEEEVAEQKQAEDAAIDASNVVLEAALDWAFADGPAARVKAEQRLYEATVTYGELARAAWAPDEDE